MSSEKTFKISIENLEKDEGEYVETTKVLNTNSFNKSIKNNLSKFNTMSLDDLKYELSNTKDKEISKYLKDLIKSKRK